MHLVMLISSLYGLDGLYRLFWAGARLLFLPVNLGYPNRYV